MTWYKRNNNLSQPYIPISKNFKKFQQDDTVQYFIISCQSLYTFRAYPMPIIRSSINCTHSIWGRQTVCVQPSSWMSQNFLKLIQDARNDKHKTYIPTFVHVSTCANHIARFSNMQCVQIMHLSMHCMHLEVMLLCNITVQLNYFCSVLQVKSDNKM
jgi:hypothetical protein